MSDARTCGNCRFMVPVPPREINAQMKGRCHRHAPTRSAFMISVQGGNGIAESTDWPGVSGTSWCGEWDAKTDHLPLANVQAISDALEAWPRTQGQG